MSSLDFVKDEVKFFMDKSYQFSFVYIAAAFAIIAGTNLDAMATLASLARMDPKLLTVLGLAALNLAYLTLASACLFSILKRGYFILTRSSTTADDKLVEWERFMRVPETGAPFMFWGVDNYFMALLYFIVWIASLGLLVYAVTKAEGTAFWIAILIGVLHVVPLFNTIATVWLDKRCRRAFKRPDASAS